MICTSNGAFADPVQMLVAKDWGAYRYKDDKGRICFVSSVPKSSKENTIQRTGETSMFLYLMDLEKLNEMWFK